MLLPVAQTIFRQFLLGGFGEITDGRSDRQYRDGQESEESGGNAPPEAKPDQHEKSNEGDNFHDVDRPRRPHRLRRRVAEC